MDRLQTEDGHHFIRVSAVWAMPETGTRTAARLGHGRLSLFQEH